MPVIVLGGAQDSLLPPGSGNATLANMNASRRTDIAERIETRRAQLQEEAIVDDEARRSAFAQGMQGLGDIQQSGAEGDPFELGIQAVLDEAGGELDPRELLELSAQADEMRGEAAREKYRAGVIERIQGVAQQMPEAQEQLEMLMQAAQDPNIDPGELQTELYRTIEGHTRAKAAVQRRVQQAQSYQAGIDRLMSPEFDAMFPSDPLTGGNRQREDLLGYFARQMADLGVEGIRGGPGPGAGAQAPPARPQGPLTLEDGAESNPLIRQQLEREATAAASRRESETKALRAEFGRPRGFDSLSGDEKDSLTREINMAVESGTADGEGVLVLAEELARKYRLGQVSDDGQVLPDEFLLQLLDLALRGGDVRAATRADVRERLRAQGAPTEGPRSIEQRGQAGEAKQRAGMTDDEVKSSRIEKRRAKNAARRERRGQGQ